MILKEEKRKEGKVNFISCPTRRSGSGRVL